MNLGKLREKYRRGYLASPCRSYLGSYDEAVSECERIAGELAAEGVVVFPAIASGACLVRGNADLDPYDNDFWFEYYKTEMEDCDYLLIAEMKGWKDSTGIYDEKEWFQSCGRPVFYLNPTTFEVR
jgi:hypothetical protein